MPSLSVNDYFKNLPEPRRRVLEAVRNKILASLPKGYEETMQYGMPTYVVPLATFPAGYLGKKDVPLPYVAIAAQKRYFAVYLMNLYGDPALLAWFTKAYAKTGKKLDMGKSCVRFSELEDLPLDLIGKAVAKTPPATFIRRYEAARAKAR
jgi:hypothetical protein